jgi:hypothetical protein
MHVQQTIANVQNPQERQFHWIQEFLTSPEEFYQNIQSLCRLTPIPLPGSGSMDYSSHLQYFTEVFVVVY